MADPNAARRWRRDARLARAERRVLAAVRDALAALAAYTQGALHQSGLDPAVLDDRAPAWRDALTGRVSPAIYQTFVDAWAAIGEGALIDPTPYGTRHLEAVWNRLVGTSDEVFDRIRGVLEAGRQEGLHPNAVARDIDALLSDADNWEGRARTIARTETIAANNAGAAGSAYATADYLGIPASHVAQTWLATSDGRTRESHTEADGQTVIGLDTPFVVGGYELAYPGDPSGPPEETANCRCTTLYEFPDESLTAGGTMPETRAETAARLAAGRLRPEDVAAHHQTVSAAVGQVADPERRRVLQRLVYGTVTADQVTAALAALADDEPTGVIVAALPSETDPVHGIGEEQKHATLAYLGDLADLPDGGLDTILDAVRRWLEDPGAGGELAPVTVPVDGLDSLGDDCARVWLLEDTDDGLRALRDALLTVEAVGDLDAEHNEHPDFTPHVTVGYPVAGADEPSGPSPEEGGECGYLDPEVETAAGNVKRITFDRLAVWAGPEQTEYPLTGPASDDTEETPVAESTTASGTLLAARRHGATRTALARTVEDLVASGFFPSREHAASYLRRAALQPITAAAGDAAPVVVEPDEAAVGDDAPTLLVEPGNDWGPNPDRFHGICTVEDEQTGDGRVFAPGAIYWDEAGLPMPLGWQVQDAPGHDGSVICGRIDTFERVGNAITYTGTWDLDGAGWETRRLVQGQFLRGISVDTDDVDAVLVTPEGEPIDGFDLFMPMGDEPPVALMQRSRLRSAALCRVPAFAPSGTEGAYIANGLPEDLVAAVDAGMEETPLPAEEEVVAALVASAVAYDLPELATDLPPGEWFADPQLDGPTPITITDDGRIYGHLAAWGTCHIGVQGTCITPPHSQTDYAHFAHGVTSTTGGPVITGLLTMETGHAAPDLRALPAAAHYDDTGTQFGTVAVGEDAIGIWVAGSVVPEVTPEQITKVQRAGALSGDWRKIRGNLELVAALAVNTPGFPIPRLSLAASAVEGQTSLVAAGVVTRDAAAAVGLADGTLTMADVRAMVASALADERASELRRGRIEAASRTLRRSRATAAVARIGG